MKRNYVGIKINASNKKIQKLFIDHNFIITIHNHVVNYEDEQMDRIGVMVIFM